jgi:hypothetical protein
MVISDRFAFDENLVLNKMIAKDRSADTFKAEVIKNA